MALQNLFERKIFLKEEEEEIIMNEMKIEKEEAKIKM